MCLRCSMALYQQTTINVMHQREERQTMKIKLYHTEVFNKTLSDVYQAGDNTAEVKRLLSKLVNHYFEILKPIALKAMLPQ